MKKRRQYYIELTIPKSWNDYTVGGFNALLQDQFRLKLEWIANGLYGRHHYLITTYSKNKREEIYKWLRDNSFLLKIKAKRFS